MAARPYLFPLLVALARAELFLPKIYSSYMVLQGHATYDQRPFINGFAAPSDLVTVQRKQPSGAADLYYATAEQDGSWITQLDPDYFRADQNDLTISIWAASNKSDVRVLEHVVYGDVFLCSGQSNMNENVYASFGAASAMAGVYPQLRLFSVAEGGSSTPSRDLPVYNRSDPNASHWCTFNQYPVPNSKQECNEWQLANEPTVIGAFSAACFYAGLELSKQLTGGRVLGLIHSSVSGTPMELWAPPEALQKCASLPSGPPTTAAPLPVAIPPGNSTLFNAMIHPISRYAIRGVWWDQGESNSGQPASYFSCLFQALIESWRRRWRIGDFAWVFAQLGAQDSAAWPNYYIDAARGAQSQSLPGSPNSTTNTLGMAVAFDIGDMGSPYPPAHVHSRRKPELGRRLALSMQHVQYALQWPASPGVINLTATANWGPPVPGAPQAQPGGALRIPFVTLDGLGVALNATADSWEGCGGTRDLVQVAAFGGAWENTSVALEAGGGAVLATPLKQGAYTELRYAANLWPQCAVYALGNGLPVVPFHAAISAGGGAAQKAEARASPAAPAASTVVTAPRVKGAWAGGWRGEPLPAAAPEGGAAATPPMGVRGGGAGNLFLHPFFCFVVVVKPFITHFHLPTVQFMECLSLQCGREYSDAGGGCVCINRARCGVSVVFLPFFLHHVSRMAPPPLHAHLSRPPQNTQWIQ